MKTWIDYFSNFQVFTICVLFVISYDPPLGFVKYTSLDTVILYSTVKWGNRAKIRTRICTIFQGLKNLQTMKSVRHNFASFSILVTRIIPLLFFFCISLKQNNTLFFFIVLYLVVPRDRLTKKIYALSERTFFFKSLLIFKTVLYFFLY